MSSEDSDFDSYFTDPHQQLKNLKNKLSKNESTKEKIIVEDPISDDIENMLSNIPNDDDISDETDSMPLSLRISSTNRRSSSRKRRNQFSSSRRRSRKGNKSRKVEDIVLLSDEENINSSPIILSDNEKSTNLDKSTNFKYSVLIMWASQVDRWFDLDANETFETLFNHYSKQNNISKDLIAFFVNENQIVKPSDTPLSLGISSGSIIDGGLLSKPYLDNYIAAVPEKNEYTIKLKIQCEHLKRPFFIHIDQNDEFRVLLNKCAQELSVSSDKLKLNFDGDPLSMSATPITMDFSGGECLDLYLKK